MKQGIIYGAFALANLIAAAVVAGLLPALAPVHFSGGAVDRLGSPWVFISMPSVTAFLSIGVLTLLLMGKKRIFALILSILGGIFAVLGWAFFAYACGGSAVGDVIFFPYAVLTLPFAEAAMLAGGILLERAKFESILLLCAGAAVYAVGVVFSCTLPKLGYIAFIVLAFAALVSAIFLLRRRQKW